MLIMGLATTLSVVLFVSYSNYGVLGRKDAAVYTINLDLEPEKRWLDVVSDYSYLIVDLTTIFQ